jgi:hypothetical protein
MKGFFIILLSGILLKANAQVNDSSLNMRKSFFDTTKRNLFIPSPRSVVSFSPYYKNPNIKPATATDRLSLNADPRYFPTIALPSAITPKEPWYIFAASTALQLLTPSNRMPVPKN